MLSILIVEDEKFIRKGLVEFHPWNQWGYERIECASDGKEGYKCILKNRPDVVITDIRMPGMDGIEMIREARRAGYENKFIIISGYADFEYAQKAIEYDVMAYLLKPIRASELKAAALRAASRLGASRQTVECGHADVNISRVLNYIASNFTREIRTKELAGMMYRSESQFNRIFKAQVNMRVAEYINKLRILRAQQLLEEEDAMIYQIAARSGFADTQYFSRVFKQATGLTPSQYKDKCHVNPAGR